MNFMSNNASPSDLVFPHKNYRSVGFRGQLPYILCVSMTMVRLIRIRTDTCRVIENSRKRAKTSFIFVKKQFEARE